MIWCWLDLRKVGFKWWRVVSNDIKQHDTINNNEHYLYLSAILLIFKYLKALHVIYACIGYPTSIPVLCLFIIYVAHIFVGRCLKWVHLPIDAMGMPLWGYVSAPIIHGYVPILHSGQRRQTLILHGHMSVMPKPTCLYTAWIDWIDACI